MTLTVFLIWIFNRFSSNNFWEQFLATILGVITAIYLERKIATRSKQKEIEKIAAFIYLELDSNLRFIRMMRDEGFPRLLQTSFWHLYKDDLSKWNMRNIAQFEYIYRIISTLYEDEYYQYSHEDVHWNAFLTRWFTFLENEIVRLLKWYDKNTDLHKSIQNTLVEYQEIEKSFKKNKENQEYIPKFHYS